MKIAAVIIILALTVCIGCDNREDYFNKVNAAPVLKVYKNGVELINGTHSDSIKIGVPYILFYSISDEESLKLIVEHNQEYGDFLITEGSKITFNGVKGGLCNVTLKTQDSFNALTSFNINFMVFSNIVPVAMLSVTKIGISSPREYEFDAGASYDKDRKFGGSIVEYEYTLQNYVCSTSLSKIRYVFGSSGQKLIKLRVKDNSGEWSQLLSKYIVVE